MRLLIGLDDSRFSETAVAFVGSLPWPAGTSVLAAAAVPPPVPVYSELHVTSAPLATELLAHQLQGARNAVERARRALEGKGLAVEARVIEGDPRVALVETARAEGVDLVVIGSHGRSGLERLVMGSVASHVVAHAPCSVLIVKQPAGG